MLLSTLTTAAVSSLLGPVPALDDHPLLHDRTGMSWVLPFEKARAAAEAGKRLLMIKPVAFGTTPDGGWWPAAEVLRAGPFSDERVVRLANRRFVPFYFDLSDRGAAGDPAARRFVIAARAALGGSSVPTPPVLFMTAAGEVVAEVSNYASPDQVLASMLEVLEEHPSFDAPTEQEEALEGIDRAESLIDRRRLEEAARLLESIDGERARYLLGRLARQRLDFEAMERHLAGLEDPDLSDDAAMERAYRCWYGGDFAALEQAVRTIPESSNRHTEARYHLGLALFHQEKVDAAREVWEATVRACDQDPWIYRCDWAHSQAGQPRGGRTSFSSSGGNKTLLRRIGYMGNRNPDLEGPPRAP